MASARKLKVIAFNCSLKSARAKEESSTESLLRQLLAELEKHGATGTTVRAVDHNIKPGVTSDEGKGDAWPALRARVVNADILVMATPKGANAIDVAYAVVKELRTLEAEWNRAKAGRKYFSDVEHPINLNIGKIEGGDRASSVPCWCRIDCRIGLYPGVPAQAAAKEISDRIEHFARATSALSNNPPRITFNGFHAEGYVLEPGSEAEAVLANAHEAAVGRPLQSFMTPGDLDARVYALYDRIPALCYGPISENIHGCGERLASLKRITGAMALFVAEWCGVEATEA
jgi:acetylornithine deacetylase/succinyl-diaminopimelate desuccinylase-like protein